jgi:hypothetical protein
VSRVETSGDRTDWMRLAALASAIVVVAGAAYVVSLVLNIPAGFPMPPSAITRLIASLSVFASAPALAVFAYSLKRACPSRATNIAFAISVIFAAVAVANRLVQLVMLEIWPERGPQLDLYVTHSFAQGAEMLAWGWLFGAVTALLARAVRVTAGAWPARLLAASGLMSLAAGLVYFVAPVVTLPDWVGGIAIAAGGLAWGAVWPLSAALFLSIVRIRRALARAGAIS